MPRELAFSLGIISEPIEQSDTLMKTIYKAANIMEAHIVAGMLTAGGFDAHVGGFYLQGAMGDLPPTEGVPVMVAEEDVAEAILLVREYDAGVASEDDGDSPGNFEA